ncbi:MAG: sigma-54 interaction domain-containing protein, partial [Verrucomicrobiales bacterium]
GTGKELAARALHFNSGRQHAPFIPINCSALPENLLESELFGHRKGAFTGALTDKKGLFAEADGGTIFLDEIGSMPPLLQSRLLRVLQEKEVRRIGDNIPTFVNVRVLAATNEPLELRIKQGTFREDLFYRLNVIPITLPSLRDRVDDIPLLVSHFLREKVHYRSGKTFQMTHQAMDALCAHDWPGNVRELQNAIERATALCEDAIIQLRDLPPVIQRYATHTSDTVFETRSDTPPSSLVILSEGLYPLAMAPDAAVIPSASTSPQTISTADEIGSLKDFLRNQEAAYLNRALSFTAGDKEKAAEILGISLATLYRKLSEVEE